MVDGETIGMFIVCLFPAMLLGLGIYDLVELKRGHPKNKPNEKYSQSRLKQYRQMGAIFTIFGAVPLLFILFFTLNSKRLKKMAEINKYKVRNEEDSAILAGLGALFFAGCMLIGFGAVNIRGYLEGYGFDEYENYVKYSLEKKKKLKKEGIILTVIGLIILVPYVLEFISFCIKLYSL